MTELLHVNGSTTQERHGATAAVDALLQDCGAAVTDYHQFSNVSVAIEFEVAAEKLPQISEGLRRVGIALTPSSLTDIDRFSAGDPLRIVSGSVQITFYHSEKDPHRLHSVAAERLHW